MAVILTYLGTAFAAGGWIATFLICMILVWKASAKYMHIKGQVDTIPDMKSDISHMKSDISYVKSDMSLVKSEVSLVKSELSHVKGEVSLVKSELSHVKSEVSLVKSDISHMKNDLVDIKSALKLKPDLLPTATQSPIALTDYGREISQVIKGDELAEKYAHKVVLSEDPSAYEIQEACRSYVLIELMNDLTKDEKARIERFAYEKGEPIEFPLRVVWIKMRDHWLKKKGIPTDNIDNHAPEDA